MAVIDICEVLLEREGWGSYLGALLGEAPRYGEVFAPRLAAVTGVEVHEIRESLHDLPRAVDRLADALAAARSVARQVADLEAHDVVQVLHGGPWPCGDGTLNDHVAGLVERHPHRFRAWAGVSLVDPARALDEAVRATTDLGMSGLSVIPFLDRVDPSSPVHDPLWRFASERELPVWIHCGQHLSRRAAMAVSAPPTLDRIARRHPDLRLVLGHGGWPWVHEVVAVLQRHPNVMLEFSSHHPATMARPGSGWEPLFLHGARSLKGQVLFGSTSWTHGRLPSEIVASAACLPLPDEARAAWLGGNALGRLVHPSRGAA